jgi:hypothetical protein
MMKVMDAIGSISVLQGMQVQQEVAYAVAAKTLDAARQQGAAAIQLIEAAGQVGQSAGADGLGAQVDVKA